MSKDSTLSGRAREVLLSRVASMLGADDTRDAHVDSHGGAQGSYTNFSTLPGYAELRVERLLGERLKLPGAYFRMHDGRLGPRTRMAGRELIDFAGYDYLGLNGHPEVLAAAKDAIDQYGISASASRHVAGERPVHRALERALADHYQAQDALVFVSGYGTNVGVIGQLVGAKDLVISDSSVHNSAVTGAVLSGATRRSFSHNNLDSLEHTLSKVRKKFERVLIVVEGLYSMDGDYPDLNRLVEIKQRFDAWLMVDEAHALGVMGARGFGLFEQCGTDPSGVDIWMGTASKTLAACGGFVAGSSVLIEYLRATVGSFVYSVAMPPVIAASAGKALEVLHREPGRVATLHANGAHFQRYARHHGLDMGLSCGLAVAPIIVGDSISSVVLTHMLAERGINVSPAYYPGVPMNTARLRFFVTAMHSTQDIEAAIDAVVGALGELPGRLTTYRNLL